MFFYSAAKLALQALYMLWQIHLSVCPSVCHHTPVLCQNEGIQRDPVFTIG